MLPPSQYGNGNGDEPLYPEYDTEIWDSQEEADQAFTIIDHWSDGTGFSTTEWLDRMIDVRNYRFDEEGDLCGFDFDFEYDGQYAGTRSVGCKG